MFRKRANQNNFFYRNNGNESSKSHGKPSHNSSNFDKHVKNDDGYKDTPKEDTGSDKNDPKPREQASPHCETVEELTKSILKWHSSRFKEIRKASLASETNHNDGLETKPAQDTKHTPQQETKHESSPENGHPKGYNRSNGGFGNYGSNFRRDRSNHERSKYSKDR